MNLYKKSLTVILAAALSTGIACGRSEKTSDIASPDYWLENYRWFKQNRAAIEQVDHTIQAQKDAIEDYKKDFENVSRAEWPRDARQTLDEKETALEGYTRQYNSLVANFNARASDITRRIADTPVGAKIAYKDSVESILNIQFRRY